MSAGRKRYKMKLIKGQLEIIVLKPIFISEITSVVKASKEMAKANGLKNADGVTVDISTRDVDVTLDLEFMFEEMLRNEKR